ncbi:MAG: hypothetical protein KC425_06245, partial [Anaerolineales bacterium]|nr:hypothetical protein [Anaerolineales bacterium]
MLPVESVQKILASALENGGDLAEVYLENKESLNLVLDDGRLEKATQGNDVGGGVRVFYGNTAAYAYTDDLTEPALLEAARAAAAAARGSNAPRTRIDLTRRHSDLTFPVQKPFDQLSAADKAAVLRRMDQAARAASPHVVQVSAQYTQTSRRVWVYNSDGVWAEDDRQIVEFFGSVTAQRGDVRQTMSGGVGGQMGLELLDDRDPVAAIVE